ncbi:hypothetical protein SELMODRAFT_422565 [Selaginella moellendorffii]|uniref:Uncharacterized protein n=1 Tax=Selaginella moellendorffii TaxID=88036 RepID=D8SIU8_SELML|nr:hypothetical protein SELMODRAFT_422565 [Selaginella moellendorffii]
MESVLDDLALSENYTSGELWKKLCEKHKQQTHVQIGHLYTEMVNMRWTESESFDQFVDDMKNIYLQIQESDKENNNLMQVDKLQLSRAILAVKKEIIMQKDVGIFHSKSDLALFAGSSSKQFVKEKNNNKASKDEVEDEILSTTTSKPIAHYGQLLDKTCVAEHTVQLGDNSEHGVHGIGDINIQTSHGNLTLTRIANMRHNLCFDHQACVIQNVQIHDVVAIAPKEGNLYQLKNKESTSSLILASVGKGTCDL